MKDYQYEAVRNDLTAIWTLKKIDIDSIYSSSEKLGVFDTFEGLEWELIIELELPHDSEILWSDLRKCGHGYSNTYYEGVFKCTI